MGKRRTIRFVLAEADFQLLLMVARTERKSIEDLFLESVPDVLTKYSLMIRLERALAPAFGRRRRSW